MSSNGSHRLYHQEDIALVALLKSCAKQKDLHKGNKLHADILKGGLLRKNIFVCSTLINVYIKCDVLAKAQQVFDELLVRDVFPWTALIKGYAQRGHGEKALICFERMKFEGFPPDAVTFACILGACGSSGLVEKGEEVHIEIERKGFLENDVVLGNSLVDMYAKCGALAKAQQVFDKLHFKDVVSWNVLITGYAQQGNGNEAINCFERMQAKGLSPNAVTLLCMLKACGSVRAAEKGCEVHGEIVRKGLLREHSLLGNALVDMYAKCGELQKAKEVFDRLSVKSKVSWTALIAGYCQHNHVEEALTCFGKMQSEGLSADALTLAWILKACGSIGALEMGKEIHVDITREGFLEHDFVLGNALVDMYAKCGAFAMARQVFDDLPMQGVVSWTALITGYCLHGHGEEALSCFKEMQNDGFFPDAVTLLCILQVCGTIGAAQKGNELHAEVVKEGLLAKDCALGTALVNMYSKCGAVVKAQVVFDDLPFRNVFSWTALMSGYASIEKHDIVFSSLNKMIGEGTDPNSVTFIVVLNSCTNLGLLNEGQTFFETMSSSYGIIPTLEHHTCMVDLFGRAGHFDKAMEMIRKMPSLDYISVWFSLLGACQKWTNVKLGRFAFEHAVRLDRMSHVPYACMSNIYIAAGMKDDANKIVAMRMRGAADNSTRS